MMTIKKIISITVISVMFLGLGSALFANGQGESDTFGYGRGAGRGRGIAMNDGRGAGRGAGNGQGRNAAAGDYDPDFHESMEEVLEGFPKGTLTEDEKAGIILMREEEKLARDVYTALYEEYGVPVFGNISASEQTHMEAMKALIDRYGITDPVATDVPGKFQSEVLQGLYDELVAAGKESLLAAVQVGAAIEELDIADLQKLIAGTDNDDIKIVYHNLEKGSRNHLRSFFFQIDRQGGDYTPQHLSEPEIRSILEEERETGLLITDPDYNYN